MFQMAVLIASGHLRMTLQDIILVDPSADLVIKAVEEYFKKRSTLMVLGINLMKYL
jgi:hypothetical protein